MEKLTLHSALMHLQQQHAALRLTKQSVAIWCPGRTVPRFIRSTVKEHADVVAAMIRVSRIETCPSPELHGKEWCYTSEEWTVDSATCAICQRLGIVG